MAIRKLARGLAWVIGVCLGVAALAYTVAVAINWNDEAPSKDAVALTRLVGNKPDVPDAENAWVIDLGLGAPAGEDPLARGIARKQWLERFTAPADTSTVLFPGREMQVRDNRSPAITALAEACLYGTADCADRVHADDALVDQWLASERWLLERTQRLETLRAWKEVIPTDVSAPIGGYSHAIHGQQLVLMQAWQQASEGDATGARASIDRDFEFWRMVLRSSDLLISKVIATAALERNLALGNLILRDLRAVGASSAPPPSWTRAMTRDELSMRRAFAGEYVFSEGVHASMLRKPISSNVIYATLARPFFKPQATSNLAAREFVRMIDRLDVETVAMPARADELARETNDELPPMGVYNALGRAVMAVGATRELWPRALRVSDLEGTRRATLLASELREQSQAPVDIDARIRDSRWKDPYTQAPFAWDAQSASIVFTGLAEGDRKRHAILY